MSHDENQTSLDYLVQHMDLSSTVILNLINMLQTMAKNNSINEMNNKAIHLKQSYSFSELCKRSISVELLDYLFTMNICSHEIIRHDFRDYFAIALKQNNERLAIFILKYQLDKTDKFITFNLWKEFHVK
jgi:hypothetical protein